MTESQPKPPQSSAFRPLIVIFLLFAGVAGVTAFSRWHVAPELVDWSDSFSVARERARTEHKPILLYFTASWCGPCQEMRRSVWTDQRIADALSAYVTVRIDIDKQGDLARQYHTESIPQFFLMDEDGNIQRSETGAMDADQFLAWLAKATASSPPLHSEIELARSAATGSST